MGSSDASTLRDTNLDMTPVHAPDDEEEAEEEEDGLGDEDDLVLAEEPC